jgi:hypothetical protein
MLMKAEQEGLIGAEVLGSVRRVASTKASVHAVRDSHYPRACALGCRRQRPEIG